MKITNLAQYLPFFRGFRFSNSPLFDFSLVLQLSVDLFVLLGTYLRKQRVNACSESTCTVFDNLKIFYGVYDKNYLNTGYFTREMLLGLGFL